MRQMLAEAEERESVRLSSALEAQRRADEEMIADHVQRELSKERNKQEIEHLHWVSTGGTNNASINIYIYR